MHVSSSAPMCFLLIERESVRQLCLEANYAMPQVAFMMIGTQHLQGWTH